MFLMMDDAARLRGALLGVGTARRSLAEADAYLDSQRMHCSGAAPSRSTADAIIEALAVQRLLDTGARLDRPAGAGLPHPQSGSIARHHPDAGRRRRANQWNALDAGHQAGWTEQAFRRQRHCLLRIFGWPTAMCANGASGRSCATRVAMICEGTSRVRRRTCCSRKVLADRGARAARDAGRTRAGPAGPGFAAAVLTLSPGQPPRAAGAGDDRRRGCGQQAPPGRGRLPARVTTLVLMAWAAGRGWRRPTPLAGAQAFALGLARARDAHRHGQAGGHGTARTAPYDGGPSHSQQHDHDRARQPTQAQKPQSPAAGIARGGTGRAGGRARRQLPSWRC